MREGGIVVLVEERPAFFKRMPCVIFGVGEERGLIFGLVAHLWTRMDVESCHQQAKNRIGICSANDRKGDG